MIHVRAGTSFRDDPELLAALASGGERAADAGAALVDAIGIEVDGVDVAAGRAEGPLLAGTAALARAVQAVADGAPRAEAHFAEDRLAVLLARRGAAAALTVAWLERPSRLLVHGLELDLAELAAATAETAGALARDLAPAGEAASQLGRTAEALARGRLRPGPGAAPTLAPWSPSPAPGPACLVALADDGGLAASYTGSGPDLGALLVPGHVLLRAAGGERLLAAGAPPFLALRDLSALAARLAEAARRGEARFSAALAGPGRRAVEVLELDLRDGTAARAGRPPHPCPALPLARAVQRAALDFCERLAAHHPPLAAEPSLAALRAAAAERLARAEELLAGDAPGQAEAPRSRRAPRLSAEPLGPGRVRRLRFDRRWEVDVGAPAGFGVLVAGDLAVAVGAGAALGVDRARGAVAWRRRGAHFAAALDGAIYLARDALECVELASGRPRWEARAGAVPERLVALVRRQGGGVVAVGRDRLVALDADGTPSWSFAPPAAHALRGAAFGPLVLTGGEGGFLYALDARTGALAWRARLPGALVAEPIGHAGDALVACATAAGGALVAVDLGTGRRRFSAELDAAPTGPAVVFAGLLAVPGTVAGDPVIAAVSPDGRLAWEAAPALGERPVALTAAGALLLAKASGGACAALGRGGEVRWSHAPGADHPPPGNAPAVAARGLALAPGERVVALDLGTGAHVGTAPLEAPVRLAATEALDLLGLDAAGVLTAAALRTHLSVL